MKSSCIQYPADEPILLIRESQVMVCDGNVCAAALLSFLEYWHNIKLEQRRKARQANDIAEKVGDDRGQDEGLLQFHSAEDLHMGLLGLYSRDTIRKAIALLVAKGFISVHKNPRPRYGFDRTHHFLFHPDALIVALASAKNRQRSPENRHPSAESRRPSPESRQAIPETTSETTTESAGAAHHALIERFVKAFRAKTGKDYDFQKGKDGEIISGLLKKHGQPECERLIDLFFRDHDGFGGYTIGMLKASINRLNSGPVRKGGRTYAQMGDASKFDNKKVIRIGGAQPVQSPAMNEHVARPAGGQQNERV